MLKKFKVEIEICGPSYSSLDDIADFVEQLKMSKDRSDEDDVYSIGHYDVYDEGEITIDDWNDNESITEKE